MDKCFVAEVPSPAVGVWREITVPGTGAEINVVWLKHLEEKGLDELNIKEGVVWAKRRG